MALLLSSHGSIAGCVRPEAEGYAALVDGLPGGPPLAHWRLKEAGGLQMTDRKGSRHGTYVSAVQFGAAGLPQDSDGAVNFAGTGHATVAHDAGLALSKFSLSFWFRLGVPPDEGDQWAIISKEQSGLNVGDLGVYFLENNEMIVQFQDASTQYRLPSFPSVSASTPHHLCIRADHTGFDAYFNGEYLGKNTSFTGAWVSNSQPLRFAIAPQLTQTANAIIDEVALYDRVVSEAEVIALSQHSQAPVVANDSFVVPENQTAVLNVVNNDIFVGQKANLTVEVVSQATHGMATVRGDNDIEFEAGAVEADESDSFSYRITDPNGTSNAGTVNVTVQNSGSQGGGTLVYEWAPLASWIDGVPLSGRNNAFVHNLARYTNPSAATVGSTLPKSVVGLGGAQDYCFNRAPTGHPSIEIHVPGGNVTASRINFAVQLWNHLSQGAGPHPRHIRVVMEVKTCKPSDPTAFKGQGLGTTGGSYPNFNATHNGAQQAGAKYLIGAYAGVTVSGGGRTNWYNAFNDAWAPDIQNDLARIDRATARWQFGSGSKQPKLYVYNFDRPARFGGQEDIATARVDDAGVEGYWHRIELEMQLTDPATVPNNARLSDPPTEPSHTGNGRVAHYLTKDIDGELGAPGAREKITERSDLIFFCKFDDVGSNDNMHTLANCGGPWFYLAYGGSVGSQAEGWAWIRRLQVYQHD